MTAAAWKHRLIWNAALLFVLLLGRFIQAQGCSQCRDNTAATPVRTQHAYRNAILLLVGTALGITSTVLLIGRRFR